MSDPGLFGPGSMAWELCRERAVVAMAPRAVILQYAHPAFAAASGAYAAGPARPGARFEQALATLSEVVFADADTARAHASRVQRMHARLEGRLPDGSRWSAGEPEALSWVLVTLLDAVVRGAELVRGRLPDDRAAAFLGDAGRFGELFGVRDVPRDRKALDRRVDDAVRDTLVVGPELRETWRFLLDGAGAGRPLLARWIGATLPRPLAVALGAPAGRGVLRVGRLAGGVGALLPAEWRFTSVYRGRCAELAAAHLAHAPATRDPAHPRSGG